MTVAVEIVVYNILSAMNAQKGGADRVELCSNPIEGGTTPSYGTIEIVRQALSIDVYVMIRPRGGNFVYSSYEYFAMRRDIEMCKRASVDGVVLGILQADGSLDKARCKKLIDFARPLKVTCHRAFDVSNDLKQTLEDCVEVGFDRILTSGGKPKAENALGTLKELTQQAGDRIVVMPGSGISEENATTIIQQTGAREIHFSAANFNKTSSQPSAVSFIGQIPSDWREIPEADSELIKRVIDKLK
jgi:copper homeostasis protein